MISNKNTTIQISKSNREELIELKLFDGETYNNIIKELIKFGKENNFQSKRIKNLKIKINLIKVK